MEFLEKVTGLTPIEPDQEKLEKDFLDFLKRRFGENNVCYNASTKKAEVISENKKGIIDFAEYVEFVKKNYTCYSIKDIRNMLSVVEAEM